MSIATVGLDIAKQIFQVHGAHADGRVVLRTKLRRNQVTAFFANLAPCAVGLEACCGSHYWARMLSPCGHSVRLIAPQFVKPYVKSNKNDANDAEAICEAVSPSAHALRPGEVANQIRGLLSEYGIVLLQHVSQLRRGLPLILEDATNELTAFSRRLFASLYDELLSLEEKIAVLDEQIGSVYQASEPCQRVDAVEGIGPLTATALVDAMISNAG